jgi:hypothetical protein
MHSVRQTVRSLVPLVCAALLAIGGCFAPITFHEGLPAWTPPAGKVEGSVGYHRMYWFAEDENADAWYLTPGFRVGLAVPPLAAEVGLTSVVVENDGEFAALLGPTLGIGYQKPGFCFVARPSLSVFSITKEDVEFNLSDAYWQLSLLAGNGYEPDRLSLSGGGRISDHGVGPVFLVDRTLGPVSLRLEGSYMFRYNDNAVGQLLSVGLSVAGPALRTDDDWGGSGY